MKRFRDPFSQREPDFRHIGELQTAKKNPTHLSASCACERAGRARSRLVLFRYMYSIIVKMALKHNLNGTEGSMIFETSA